MFAPGDWVGMELERPEGKNSGTVKACAMPSLVVIRYFGPTMFAPGDWVGMELERPEGKNSGTVKGIQYFKCAPNCGLFVKSSILRAEGNEN
eukprot:CAMPEP_0177623662 /NCGR_PEP_ID=MMETSP0419_2-20121207/29022_1 /TAXON_ID=582737 /ORGANISM="Tetraselmis sp., Strain GSL018" /LENGTH=91 /DNA_ID=CAMNT_0019124229 /DNA_START=267 /DNA_END=542 /DNA_ORIENTATION=+